MATQDKQHTFDAFSSGHFEQDRGPSAMPHCQTPLVPAVRKNQTLIPDVPCFKMQPTTQ